mgnify:FL=1
MKKSILIGMLMMVGMFLTALSCVERLPVEAEPELAEQGVCLLRAQMVEDDSFVWTLPESRIGVYSGSSANSCWTPRAYCIGKSGEAEIFGPEAKGEVYAYWPYSEEGYSPCADGRVRIPSEQKWHDSFESHIAGNAPHLVACAEDGRLRFRRHCGALHVRVMMDFVQNVQNIVLNSEDDICGDYDVSGLAEEKLVNGGKSIRLTGIDRPAGASEPLDVWIMLPPGTYSGLFVTVSGGEETATAVIDGSVRIESGRQTEADASERRNDYEGGDFVGEVVEFD